MDIPWVSETFLAQFPVFSTVTRARGFGLWPADSDATGEKQTSNTQGKVDTTEFLISVLPRDAQVAKENHFK